MQGPSRVQPAPDTPPPLRSESTRDDNQGRQGFVGRSVKASAGLAKGAAKGATGLVVSGAKGATGIAVSGVKGATGIAVSGVKGATGIAVSGVKGATGIAVSGVKGATGLVGGVAKGAISGVSELTGPIADLLAAKASGRIGTPRMGTSGPRSTQRVHRDWDSTMEKVVSGKAFGEGAIHAFILAPRGDYIVLGLERSVKVLYLQPFGPHGALKLPFTMPARQPGTAPVVVTDVVMASMPARSNVRIVRVSDEQWTSASRCIVAALEGAADGVETPPREVLVLHATVGVSFRLSVGQPVTDIALTPSGSMLAVTGLGKVAEVFTIEHAALCTATSKFRFDLAPFVNRCGMCLEFSPDGKDLIVGGDKRKATVWDLMEPRREQGCVDYWTGLRKVISRGGIVYDIAFDEDGSVMALACGDSQVAIFSASEAYAPIAQINLSTKHNVRIAISFPDVQYVAELGENPELALMPHCGHPSLYGKLIAIQSRAERAHEPERLAIVHLESLLPVTQTVAAKLPCFTRSGLYAELKHGGEEESAVRVLHLNSNSHRLFKQLALPSDEAPPEQVSALAVSADGGVLALYRQGGGQDVQITDTRRGELLLPEGGGPILEGDALESVNVAQIKFAPDVARFAIAVQYHSPDAVSLLVGDVLPPAEEDGHAQHPQHSGHHHHGSQHGGAAGRTAPRLALRRVAKWPGKVSERNFDRNRTGQRYSYEHVLHWSLDGSHLAICYVEGGTARRASLFRNASAEAEVDEDAEPALQAATMHSPAADERERGQQQAGRHVLRVYNATSLACVFTHYVDAKASSPATGDVAAAIWQRVPLRRVLDGPGRAWAAQFSFNAFFIGHDTCARLSALLAGIGAQRLSSYAPSQDCRFVAAGGNGCLLVVDASTCEATLRVPTASWVTALEWSADDRLLAVGGHDQSVVVLDVTTGIRVLASVGGPRKYKPSILAFDANGPRNGCALADANSQFSLYSVDGSRVALRKHVDAAPLLALERPRWELPASDDQDGLEPSRQKHIALLVDLVCRNPILALNPLPDEKQLSADFEESTLYADRLRPPLPGGCCRLLEYLVARQERQEVRALVEAMPALALLPSPYTLPGAPFEFAAQTPAFEIALQKRDVRLLRTLLLASCRAPVALRHVITERMIPRIVELKLTNAIASFLTNEGAQLEVSGAAITAACNADGSPFDGSATELHRTWGGEGTRIWRGVDSSLLGKIGVEVVAKRVPLPGLTRCKTLQALLEVEQPGTFNSPLLSPFIDAVWAQSFKRQHDVQTLMCFLHFGVCCAYSALLASGSRSFWVQPSSSKNEGYVVAALGVVVIALGANLLRTEVKQLSDAGIRCSNIRAVMVAYLSDYWNVLDLANVALTVAAVASEFVPSAECVLQQVDSGRRLKGGGGTQAVGVIGSESSDSDAAEGVDYFVCRNTFAQMAFAWALIFQFAKLMQELRGYNYTGWLVEALTANLLDFLPFLLIVFLFVTAFAFIFLLMFSPSLDLARIAGGIAGADIDSGFGSVPQGWISSYAIGMFGAFDLTKFTDENTLNKGLTLFFFVFYMLILGIVVLNALIAFLGESYARVQEGKEETRLRLRTSLMCDSYNMFSTARVRKIEEAAQWLHVLELVDDELESDSQAQVRAVKKAVRETDLKSEMRLQDSQKRLADAIETSRAEQSRAIDELTAKLEQMSAEIARMQSQPTTRRDAQPLALLPVLRFPPKN